jgi:predicted metal-binding protein
MKAADFSYLLKKAKELGAVEAKVIPASSVAVEDRVRLKCLTGCDDYGLKFCCPPHAPTVDEFRRMLKDYRFALFLKFQTAAETSDDVTLNIMRYMYDPDVPANAKEKAQSYYAKWLVDAKKILLAVLELERTAFNHGCPFAVGFMAGSCMLCTKCDMSAAACTHPTMMRYPEHAVGINMMKTAKNAGSPIAFPVKGKPEATALLLID